MGGGAGQGPVAIEAEVVGLLQALRHVRRVEHHLEVGWNAGMMIERMVRSGQAKRTPSSRYRSIRAVKTINSSIPFARPKRKTQAPVPRISIIHPPFWARIRR
jgi:hypothetical protein